MGKTILILGGGVGGLVVANELRAKLSVEHRIVLVERDSNFLFSPSLLWLMTEFRSCRKQTRRPLPAAQDGFLL
jgi:sulfide:quinone oxidoreductase